MSALSATNADRFGASDEEEEHLAHLEALSNHLRIQTEIANKIAADVHRERQRRAAEALGGDERCPAPREPLPLDSMPLCPNCRKTAGVAEQWQTDTSMRWFICTLCSFLWRIPHGSPV